MTGKMKSFVLVVEDDRFLVKAYEAKLAAAGYQATVAHDGEEALAVLKKQTPGIVLLDLVMPKMNGFEVLEQMKANPAWAKIPVVILSNLGQESDQKKGMELGAVDYLVKTDFSLQQIIDIIKKHLKK
jgi:DNA-binding response OmpR family regulator